MSSHVYVENITKTHRILVVWLCHNTSEHMDDEHRPDPGHKAKITNNGLHDGHLTYTPNT